MKAYRKQTAMVGVIVVGALWSSTSFAQAKESGFEIGGRIAYGLPLGQLQDEGTYNDLDDAIGFQIPLWLDIGYRINPHLMVGGYVSYGFGGEGDHSDCAEDADCTYGDLRVGGQIQYHIQPGQNVDPWFGAGIGYEWLMISGSGENQGVEIETDVTGRGFEFLNLSLGLDFPIGDVGGIGPFVGFTLAQYDSYSVSLECSGSPFCSTLEQERDEDIDEKALHHWLFLGVRGTFVL